MNRLLVCLVILASIGLGSGGIIQASQSPAYVSEFGAGTSPLCNKTFADANGTGIYWIDPGIAQLTNTTTRAAWAVTLQNAYGSADASADNSSSVGLWYNTGGANYSDDLALTYDVCAIGGMPLNDNAVARGQTDNGTCLSALDQPCVSAIKTAVQKYSVWLTTPSPGPNSNLTSTSLPTVCTDIANMLRDNFPKECSYFFQEEQLQIFGYPLTTYGDNPTPLSDCTINGTFQNGFSVYSNSSLSTYVALNRGVLPAIAAFMPVANYAASTTIAGAVAELSCLRINTINPGSYTPPAAPKPTPIHYGTSHGGLSGGAIAGIVVSVVVLAGLVVGLGFWWWNQRKATLQSADFKGRHELHHGDSPPGMAEVSADATHYELAATERVELPAGDHRYLLDGKELAVDSSTYQPNP